MPVRVSRQLAQFLPVFGVLIVAALIALAFTTCVEKNQSAPETLILATATPRTQPIVVQRLEIAPTTLGQNEPAILYNGICNTTDKTLTVEMYFGIEKEVGGLSQGERVHLLRRTNALGESVPVFDRPGERAIRTFDPGCYDQAPIVLERVPAELTPGMWKLVIHIVSGPIDLTKSSGTFEVRPVR